MRNLRGYHHNCYIPVENGTTEIDLLVIHETGLYVVESKITAVGFSESSAKKNGRGLLLAKREDPLL